MIVPSVSGCASSPWSGIPLAVQVDPDRTALWMSQPDAPRVGTSRPHDDVAAGAHGRLRIKDGIVRQPGRASAAEVEGDDLRLARRAGERQVHPGDRLTADGRSGAVARRLRVQLGTGAVRRVVAHDRGPGREDAGEDDVGPADVREEVVLAADAGDSRVGVRPQVEHLNPRGEGRLIRVRDQGAANVRISLRPVALVDHGRRTGRRRARDRNDRQGLTRDGHHDADRRREQREPARTQPASHLHDHLLASSLVRVLWLSNLHLTHCGLSIPGA